METVRTRLERLYTGRSRVALFFRLGLLAFDILTISLFLVLTFVDEHAAWVTYVDIIVALVLTFDYVARFWLENRKLHFFFHFSNLADLVVIGSLIAHAFVENLAFLRVLRALRLLRSYHVLGMLRGRHKWVRSHEEILVSSLNLVVFIFICTALVYVTQDDINPAIETYVDALYFTIATLTTTGFGDITLQGDAGRLMAVLIMVFGISLFIRLVQTVFRPARVRYRCKECGLSRHDPDAVHCKHCGETLNIPTEGAV